MLILRMFTKRHQRYGGWINEQRDCAGWSGLGQHFYWHIWNGHLDGAWWCHVHAGQLSSGSIRVQELRNISAKNEIHILDRISMLYSNLYFCIRDPASNGLEPRGCRNCWSLHSLVHSSFVHFRFHWFWSGLDDQPGNGNGSYVLLNCDAIFAFCSMLHHYHLLRWQDLRSGTFWNHHQLFDIQYSNLSNA